MLHALRISTSLCLFALAGSASAAIIDVTGATLKAAFANAQAGDTLRVTGSVGEIKLAGRSFSSNVIIDATGATFSNSLVIDNVTGLKIVGGTFGSATTATRLGRAVSVYGSRNITFSKNTFIGTGLGVGMLVTDSTGVGVSAAKFNNFKLGAGIISSTNVRVSSSRFAGMASDGMNIADSHFVTATANRCTDAVVMPEMAFHMDCIQLWSIAGRPVQSDIFLTNNYVSGPMQGFTSFNPANGGGLRITISGNVVSTSMPQGIACYACVDSTITNNTLTTLPGSRWRTSLNVVGGSNNFVEGNTIGSLADARYLPPTYRTNGDALSSGIVPPTYLTEGGALSGAMLSSDMLSAGLGAAAAVPEPYIWAQLLLGFGLVGVLLRRGKTSGFQVHVPA